MKVFHDTRNEAFRFPYGAVAVGVPVKISVDVAEADVELVQLRTWVDGVGETLYDMEPLAGKPSGSATDAWTRYSVELAHEQAGIVWYQFVITDTEGFLWRYGAQNNRAGGVGQLVGWEPPSFKLNVYDPQGEAPVWHEPIASTLHDDAAHGSAAELIATLLECYPTELCKTAMPWDCAEELPLPAVRTMADALEEAKGGKPGFAWFAIESDVFGFWHAEESGALTCALFNASPHVSRDVFVPMVNDEVSELVGGYAVPVVESAEASVAYDEAPKAERYARVFLWQFGSAILHFHAKERLARPMEAGLGVLAHITSLPASGKHPGTLGKPARWFVDWLADAGVRYWQVLPVNPTDDVGSPYAGISAFAGNARLMEGDPAVAAEKTAAEMPEEYRAFCENEAEWLNPYACFMAIREKVGGGKPWQQLPKKFRHYDPALMNDAKLAASAEAYCRLQFAFHVQWGALRAYANERGIQIIGDMPIYVSTDSADVWAHPDLFQLGSDGNPHVVAGCPPDAFAVEGQIWGNPVYDWDAEKAEGFAWWLRRLKRSFDLYDFVRLDHFIGFSRYFSIPIGESALAGSYRLGPGFELFRLAHEEFGKLPVIAEDLGLLTPRVRMLVAECGFYGMDIVQFADGGDPLAGYEPRPEKIVYTGTHDNQTLLGFVRDRYPDTDEASAFNSLVDKVVNCGAPVRILPLQDLIGLGDEARMNVPGVAKGNWIWQAKRPDVEEAQDRTRTLAMG